MKRKPWFKLWFEARTDGKIRALPMEYRWIWVALLSYASEQEDRGTIQDTVEIIAAQVADGDTAKFLECLGRLKALKLVTASLEPDDVTNHEVSRERHVLPVTISFPAFKKRQADVTKVTKMTDAERAAKARAKKKLRQYVTDVTPRHAEITPESPRVREEDRGQRTEEKNPPSPKGGVCVSSSIIAHPEPTQVVVLSSTVDPAVQVVADWAESQRPGERWGSWVTEMVRTPYDPAWIKLAMIEAKGGDKLDKRYVAGILKRFAAQGGPKVSSYTSGSGNVDRSPRKPTLADRPMPLPTDPRPWEITGTQPCNN